MEFITSVLEQNVTLILEAGTEYVLKLYRNQNPKYLSHHDFMNLKILRFYGEHLFDQWESGRLTSLTPTQKNMLIIVTNKKILKLRDAGNLNIHPIVSNEEVTTI